MSDVRSLDGKLVQLLFGRGLSDVMNPRLANALQAEGISAKSDAPVQREAMLRGLAAAAQQLHPGLPASEAHLELGRDLATGLTSSWRVKATLAAARAMGTEAALGKLLGRHPLPSNFLEISLERTAPGRYALTSNLGAPNPEVLAGLAEQLLQSLGAKGVEVQLTERGERERLEIRLPR